LTGLEFVFICKTDKSKLVKQEVNGTVKHPVLVFPGLSLSIDSTKSQFYEPKKQEEICAAKNQLKTYFGKGEV
jgi:hypothetical protein